jgi:hypothetical protein
MDLSITPGSRSSGFRFRPLTLRAAFVRDRVFLAVSAFLLAILLLVTWFMIIIFAGSLMQWLIWLVGYERALGQDNVIRRPGGGVLLTNPTAMMAWMAPFLILGCIQIASSLMLILFGVALGGNYFAAAPSPMNQDIAFPDEAAPPSEDGSPE